MSCKRPLESNTHDFDQSSDPKVRALLTDTLFQQLSGLWILNRTLQSTNTLEPAGKCLGTATFTPRPPSVFIKDDGKLDTAAAELVYHEQGYFEMHQAVIQANNPRFQFSRKYVWRLQRESGEQQPVVSIWFTQPGTEKIDYLFHKINITLHEADDGTDTTNFSLHGDGGHLCEEDLYSSEYTFELSTANPLAADTAAGARLQGWQMLHEVRGPSKDQTITTKFSRE